MGNLLGEAKILRTARGRVVCSLRGLFGRFAPFNERSSLIFVPFPVVLSSTVSPLSVLRATKSSVSSGGPRRKSIFTQIPPPLMFPQFSDGEAGEERDLAKIPVSKLPKAFPCRVHVPEWPVPRLNINRMWKARGCRSESNSVFFPYLPVLPFPSPTAEYLNIPNVPTPSHNPCHRIHSHVSPPPLLSFHFELFPITPILRANTLFSSPFFFYWKIPHSARGSVGARCLTSPAMTSWLFPIPVRPRPCPELLSSR